MTNIMLILVQTFVLSISLLLHAMESMLKEHTLLEECTVLHRAIFRGNNVDLDMLLRGTSDPARMLSKAPTPITVEKSSWHNHNRTVLSNDGKKVLTYYYNEMGLPEEMPHYDDPDTIIVWDVFGNEIGSFQCHWGVEKAFFSPSDSKVCILIRSKPANSYTSQGITKAVVWDLTTNQRVTLKRKNRKNYADDEYFHVQSAVFSPDELRILTEHTFGGSSLARSYNVWNMKGNTLPTFSKLNAKLKMMDRELRVGSRELCLAHFSPDSKKVTVTLFEYERGGSYQNDPNKYEKSTTYLLDLQGTIEIAVKQNGKVEFALIAPHNRGIITVKYENVTFWDETGKKVSNLYVGGNALYWSGMPAFSPNDARIAIQISNGPPYNSHLRNFQKGTTEDVKCHRDCLAILWNIPEGTAQCLRYRGRPRDMNHNFITTSPLQWSSDGKYLLAITEDGTAAVVWNAEGHMVRSMAPPFPVNRRPNAIEGRFAQDGIVHLRSYFRIEHGGCIDSDNSAFFDLRGNQITQSIFAPIIDYENWHLHMGVTPLDWAIVRAGYTGDIEPLKLVLQSLKRHRIDPAEWVTQGPIFGLIHATARAYKCDTELYRKFCSVLKMLAEDSGQLLQAIKDTSGQRMLDWAQYYALPEHDVTFLQSWQPESREHHAESIEKAYEESLIDKQHPVSHITEPSAELPSPYSLKVPFPLLQTFFSHLKEAVSKTQSVDNNSPLIDIQKPGTTVAASDQKDTETRAVPRKDDSKIEEDQECAICLEPIKERYVVVPCGHANTCYDCISRLKKCPICSKDIGQVIKVFF